MTLIVLAATVGAGGCFRRPVDRQTTTESATRSTSQQPESHEPVVPFAVGGHGEFVTSQACQKCHPQQHQSWHASYHRTMTQFVTPQAVAAPLEGTKLESRGRTYEFQRRGDKFYVTMASPEWEMERQQQGADLSQINDPPLTTRELVIMTGSHHMQTYWIRAEDGFRQVPWYWHILDKRWIPAEDSFLQPPSLRRTFSRWNDVCIKCHSVGEIPGIDVSTGFDTRVAELGIACEACHGHGKQHVALHEGTSAPSDPAASPPGDPEMAADPIVNPADQTHIVATQICAQCHSSAKPRDLAQWGTSGMRFQPGDNLNEHFHLVRFGRPVPADREYLANDYWADGTCRTAGDEYQGLLESACHTAGQASCLSCHSLHQYADRNDQLKRGMEGNDACLQCHAEYGEKLSEHTHHAAGSSGSLCYNCHMPHITYGLLKAIRSHRIDSPSASITAKTGRPNACNLCHTDKTLAWTADHLSQWYDQPAVELSQDERTIAASIRWLLAGDASQRVIAAWHLGWPESQAASGNDWQAPFLAQTLDDPYSAIRFVGQRSLKTLPGFAELEYDFVGNPVQRKATIPKVLSQWRQTHPDRKSKASVLLGEQGELRRDEIDRLRRERDNRPITIHE